MFTIRVATGVTAIALLTLTACNSSAESPGVSPLSAILPSTELSSAPSPNTPPPGPETASSGSAMSVKPVAGLTTPSKQVKYRALPVYYVVDTAAGFRLYREFHRVLTADPASDAVREMLTPGSALDPDYQSLWPAGTRLRSPVQHCAGVITVDLTGQARTGQFGAEVAEMTVQQLVYTVQGALQSTDPVRILVEGKRIEELWGHVFTGEPIHRANQYATRSLVQINEPAEGARLPRTFTVTGEAAAYEANVPWEVLRNGTVVLSGYTMTPEAGRFGPFRFSLTLEPGEYVVRVMEDGGASPGEGRPPFDDTKRIRVVD